MAFNKSSCIQQYPKEKTTQSILQSIQTFGFLLLYAHAQRKTLTVTPQTRYWMLLSSCIIRHKRKLRSITIEHKNQEQIGKSAASRGTLCRGNSVTQK